ncbi:caldesmon isoform X4 [Drosophila bipectinata]|uniref:caldesmon isoform X4 n=2 Tax=Drosophila bipectinata TaxID=42026 RepID=UPI0038B30989
MVRSTARASLRKAASTLSNNSGDSAPLATAPVAAATPSPAAAPPAPRERSLAKRIKAPACDRCPHCDRSFNPKAFDRHVEWCKEKAIQATMKSGNSQETSKAKERLEARKQYRPPNLKTKRSLARDKYSGHHEEVLEAGDMSAPKPNMMSLSMTSSVHSDNNQMVKVRGEPSRGTTQVTNNQMSLYRPNDEDPPSSPPPRERISHRSKRKPSEACSEIDETMDRLRRVEPQALKPARSRKSGSRRDKLEMGDKEISLPNLPQVTMTFDELNGLIKRKGGTPICNVQLDDQEIARLAAKTSHTSIPLVRQARRRLRNRENPNLELRALEQDAVLPNNVEFASLDSSLVPLHRKQREATFSVSEDESPRAEIQIKLESTTMRTLCRPKKRSGAGFTGALSSSEPMRALPMPQLKQSLEAINQSIGKVSLPRLELGNEIKEQEAYDQDEETSELDFDDDLEKDDTRVVVEEPLSEEEEEIVAAVEEPVMTLPPLIKQGNNVSRRLVLLEQDENGTMYIKTAPNGKRRLKRSDSNMSGNTDVSSQHEEIEKQSRQAETEKQSRQAEIEKQSRLAEMEKQSRLTELEMQTRLAEMEKQSRLVELETQSRLAELEKRAAAEDQQKREIFNRNSADDQQKREIFISIETEANAQGKSPISPDSLRHMVGNSQTPIDVLHIENGNEPEHAKFSKISDTEDVGEELGDRPSQLSSNRLVPSSSSCVLAPNVQLNNAKNLIQKMQSDFRQLGEEAGASMRRTLIANGGRSEEQQQIRDPEPNGQQQHTFQQQPLQHQQVEGSSPPTPSPSADSDELSSLDSYTMLSRGTGSKISTDSAYGSNSPFSLSRQRSSELQLMRPHTASAKLASNLSDASTQAQIKYGTLKARQRLFANNGSSIINNNGSGDGAESSSSGSENSLEVQQNQQHQQHQQLTSNYNYQQQQQHQAQSPPAYNSNTINNNTSVLMTPSTSQHSLFSRQHSSTSSMSSSMKMSKFCHECGAKFIIEHAKFCMECGVRRMVL